MEIDWREVTQTYDFLFWPCMELQPCHNEFAIMSPTLDLYEFLEHVYVQDSRWVAAANLWQKCGFPEGEKMIFPFRLKTLLGEIRGDMWEWHEAL